MFRDAAAFGSAAIVGDLLLLRRRVNRSMTVVSFHIRVLGSATVNRIGAQGEARGRIHYGFDVFNRN